jgi:phosphopantetheine adenylyltransferase
MSPKREAVVERAFEQADQVMVDLVASDPKERLAAVRVVVALVEAAEGKHTVVEHRYPERAPSPGEEFPVNA